MEEKQRLLILYASQTGNAVDVAERIGREAECMGCASVVLSVGDFDVGTLPLEEYVIFVASTTGQGEIPDSMKAFWRFLLRRNLGPVWLEGLCYALFGLGDSSYQKFNFVAKKLDKRLSDLGARAIIERGLGDDQHPFGYEGALDSWLSFLWKKLCQMKPVLFPRGYDSLEHGTKALGHPKLEILYHSLDKADSSTEISDLKCIELQIEKARFMHPQKFRQEENKPHCILQMIKNKFLTKPGCGKDVHHLEFQALSAINYEVGDVVEVLPSQDPVLVDAFICRCKMDPDSYITVRPLNGNKSDIPMDPVNLRSFVAHTMDVASASPRRYFFEVMSYFATAEHEKERLQYFASAEGRDDLYQYNQKERRTVLEVLEDFSSVQMPFEWMVQLVPPLLTRAFSISSSPSAHPNQIHLTVGVVSLMTPFKRKRFGLCSSWLTGLDPKKEVYIPAWIHHGSLPPPPPTLPLILVGPGTGCAPFHAFIEERALQSRTGPTAPILFFFGCRNEENDFLYRDFWLFHSKGNGVLSEVKGGGFFVAFSRDQPQKIYVQHKMLEEKERIWNLLSTGAAIFIAGSANKMPSDVLSAMEEIVSMESNVPRESAARWLKLLNSTSRYNVEAWM